MVRNILLIGGKGSGKSTLANILFDKFEGRVEPFFEGKKTLKIRSKEIEIEGENYRIIDTIGIGETGGARLNDEEKQLKIIEICREIIEDGLTQVLFVINGRI